VQRIATFVQRIAVVKNAKADKIGADQFRSGGPMRQSVVWLALAVSASQYLSAQSEAALWEYFEGRTVIAKVDLPATKAGFDIYPDGSPALNDAQYAKQLKQFGVAKQRNDLVTITDFKVKPKSIEIEFGGGNSGNETSAPVYAAAVESQREKNLERDVERETDPVRKEKMEKELDDLRAQRAREDERLKAALAQLARASADTSRGASSVFRFNLVFPGGVPSRALRPEYVMAALKPWLDFDQDSSPTLPDQAPPGVERAPSASERPPSPPGRTGTTTELRKGLSESDLLRILGDPVKREPYIEGDLHVEILTFKKNETMVEATMVEGVLVRFREWSD
jgi:hypothetical protein